MIPPIDAPYKDVIADIDSTAESMSQLLGTHLAAWKVADQPSRMVKASAELLHGWGITCVADGIKNNGRRWIRMELNLTFQPSGVGSHGDPPVIHSFMMPMRQLSPDIREQIKDFINRHINEWFQKATVAGEARQSNEGGEQSPGELHQDPPGGEEDLGGRRDSVGEAD